MNISCQGSWTRWSSMRRKSIVDIFVMMAFNDRIFTNGFIHLIFKICNVIRFHNWRINKPSWRFFVVKSREMWCEMKELRMGHTKRISHSEFWVSCRRLRLFTANFSRQIICCQKGLDVAYRKRRPLGIVLKRTARGVLLFGMGRRWPLITANFSQQITCG